MINISTKWASLLTGLACAAFANQTQANTTLTIGDGHELGFVDAGIPAGDANVTSYVNQLVGMGLNTSTSFGGNSFARSGNTFSPLDSAVLDSRSTYVGYSNFRTDPSTLNLTLGAGDEYLLVKYDGPNSGSEVWYIGNLSGSVTIPTFNGQYGISGASLFVPGKSGVPDGGATLALLGLGCTAVGGLRRRLGNR